jgi:hypothetical protein
VQFGPQLGNRAIEGRASFARAQTFDHLALNRVHGSLRWANGSPLEDVFDWAKDSVTTSLFRESFERPSSSQESADSITPTTRKEHIVKQTLVRYKTKQDKAQENAGLIEAVFRELRATSPEGVRYLVLRLDDGTFVHFHSVAEGAKSVSALEAFQSFQSGIADRLVEPVQANDAIIIGNYRMLDEGYAELVGRSS